MTAPLEREMGSMRKSVVITTESEARRGRDGDRGATILFNGREFGLGDDGLRLDIYPTSDSAVLVAIFEVLAGSEQKFARKSVQKQ